MSFVLGLLGGKSKKTAPTVASGLDLQSSSYGKPVPIIYGTTRAAANLVWYGDFVAIPQSSSAGAGGKGGIGGGGGGKGGSTSSYVYQASFQFALSEGPIQGAGNVYVNKNVVSTASLGLTVFTGTYPQDPWGYLVSTHGPLAEAHTIPGSPYQVTVTNASSFLQDYGVVGPFSGSVFTYVASSPAAGQYSVNTNASLSQITYEFNSADAGANVIITYQQGGIGTTQTAQTVPTSGPYEITLNARNAQDEGVILGNAAYTKVGGSPAANEYSVNSSTGVYTFNSANAGAAVTITYSAANQSPPFQALGYNGIAHIDAAAYQLGNSPSLPNHNFEVQGIFSASLSGLGVPDADPSLVVADLLTNAHYGAGFPTARLGSLTTYQAYCIANGLWISPAYVDQAQASSMLDDIAKATNSEWVWSMGLLTLVPYGDQSITANGYTYTAPSAPLYDLTDDDFAPLTGAAGSASASSNPGPVLMSRKRPADQLNSIKVEWVDRTSNYNVGLIEAKDQALINLYGLRQGPTTAAHLFADGAAAQLSAQLQLQRQSVMNVYSFQLDQRYVVLDPMDIVTITDAALGLSQQWVRINEITENDDGSLSVLAEEYLAGTGNAAQHSFQAGLGFNVNYNSSPGNANPPVIFEPPSQITDTGLEVWLATSGGENWGGCDVFASTDGDTYKKIGRVSGSCRQGVLTQDLPDHADPDTADTLSVDLSQSQGILISGTQSDADNLHTLCYVAASPGYELVSYQTAQLTSSFNYNLTYLRRGAYGTATADHSSSSKFARLDNGLLTVPYDKSQLGQTIFFKLVGFNVYGGGQQNISDVAPYSYTIQGPPLPQQVQNFQVHQQGNAVTFSWTDVPTDAGIQGYDVGYAPQGTTDWGHFVLLTNVHRGTEMTNAAVPPGTWTFGIRAHDLADNLGPIATADFTVVNNNNVLATVDAPIAWDTPHGSSMGLFVVHPTGALVPQGRFTSDTYLQQAAPGAPVLDQIMSGSLGSHTYYVKITYLGLYGETTTSPEASLAVSAGNVLIVMPDPADVIVLSPIFFNVYAGLSPGSETLQNAAPILMAGGSGGNTWQMPDTGLVTGASPPTANSTGWDVFDIFVPDPINTLAQDGAAWYQGLIADIGFTDTVRAFVTYAARLGPGQQGELSGITTYLDSWTGTINDDPFNYPPNTPGASPFTLGTVTAEFFSGALNYLIETDGSVAAEHNPGNVGFFTDFQLTVDKATVEEEGNGVTIAPGGTTITFPTAFHDVPLVQVTAVAGTGLYATASSITDTSCVINVWNSSGTSVGGTVNWTASGV